MRKILVIGALGQIGSDLVVELKRHYGQDNIIASDIRNPVKNYDGIFEILNVLDRSQLTSIVKKFQINEIYHLAAVLSGNAEKKPIYSWDINMNGLFNVLEVAKEHKIRVFWPSSIAVFGPTSPKIKTPQTTIMEPITVYGISKLAGERWIEYYNKKYDVDVRSIRYPGLISYTAEAGGGTTDYAVEIYYEAVKHAKYECFLKEDTYLPMLFMPDALQATIDLMELPETALTTRTSYNVSGLSFCPKDLVDEIKKHIPDFEITYKPDFRQAIAESWPHSIDDSVARSNDGWKHKYDIAMMTEIMLREVKIKLGQ
jgi:nucleoside-diphosphate-sugar epimerase